MRADIPPPDPERVAQCRAERTEIGRKRTRNRPFLWSDLVWGRFSGPAAPGYYTYPLRGKISEEAALVVQDHGQEAIVNRQRAVASVIDKAQRPELVHEMTDPRPGGADHLGQVFLIDSGMDHFSSAFLAKMRQQ